jgi:hypothetical protein
LSPCCPGMCILPIVSSAPVCMAWIGKFPSTSFSCSGWFARGTLSSCWIGCQNEQRFF